MAPAAQEFGLPEGLLEAVGLTESGVAGAPYPWALNVAGRPILAPSRDAALLFLRQPDGMPRRDVAIGCLQIHMRYHLGAVGTPEQALQPAFNVRYGAALLAALHRRHGAWPAAVAHYHAGDPVKGRAYTCRVARNGALAILGLSAADCVPQDRNAATIHAGLMAARQAGGIVVLTE